VVESAAPVTAILARRPALVADAPDLGRNSGQVDKNRVVLDSRQAERWDPFVTWSDDWFSKVGFPWHPHRGFQTITLVLEGLLEHRDNAGGFGILGPGDAQYMAAGRYALHYELAYQRQPVHTLQLWLNLPPEKKLMDTRYRDLRAEDATVIRDEGVEVRLHAGEHHGQRGVAPAEFEVPFTLIDAQLAGGARFVHELPGDHAAVLYVVEGGLALGPDRPVVGSNQLAWFEAGDPGASELAIEAEANSRFIAFSAAPIGAPVVAQGRFVMNTIEEINQALEDYKAGRFGPIPTDDPVDPRSRAAS
jgi:quercetin 2,3-dioxygenase